MRNVAPLDERFEPLPPEPSPPPLAPALLSGVTMLAHVPSVAALESDDNDVLVAELRLARLRSQVAVVRALADHVEHLARSGDADGLGSQVIEEMARLGYRLLEVAGAGSQPAEQSEAFARERLFGSAG